MALIHYSNDKLTKYCDEEFNIQKGCNTLRLGTLFDFREEENEKLRDKGEGKFEYRVEFPSLTPVSQSWMSSFDLVGGNSVKIDEVQITNAGTSVKGFTMDGSASNAWVFCMSYGDSKTAGNITENYLSSWVLDGDKAGEFGVMLGKKVFSNLKMSDLPETLLARYSFEELKQGLALNFRHGPITYGERKVRIQSEADFPPEKIAELISLMPFKKPSAFVGEREYRFLFEVQMNGSPVSVNKGAKIIELREVDGFLMKNGIDQ